MRDVLAGGCLTLTGPRAPSGSARALPRRQRHPFRRGRHASRPRVGAPTAVPGQLVSPLLTGGFPSLALH